MFPSSNWLGHHSFTVKIRDRAPVGMPNSMRGGEVVISPGSLPGERRIVPYPRNHNSKDFNSTLKRNFENLENSD